MIPRAWAFLFEDGHDIANWSLASVEPTLENTHAAARGVSDLTVIPLGTRLHHAVPFDTVHMAFTWRKAWDHRGTRGKYLHRHKGKAKRRHRQVQRRIQNAGWAIAVFDPKLPAPFVVHKLYSLD